MRNCICKYKTPFYPRLLSELYRSHLDRSDRNVSVFTSHLEPRVTNPLNKRDGNENARHK